MIDNLRGIGHFTIWYAVGFFIFLIFKPGSTLPQKSLSGWALYSPFLPFILGGIAVIPYLCSKLGIATDEKILHGYYNLFLGYGELGQFRILNKIFGVFEINALLIAVMYAYLLQYYIKLVKRSSARHAK